MLFPFLFVIKSFSFEFFIYYFNERREEVEKIKIKPNKIVYKKYFSVKLWVYTPCVLIVIHTIKQSKWTRRDDDLTDGIECKRQARVLPKKKRHTERRRKKKWNNLYII